MKTLVFIIVAIFAFKTFAAEVGEDQKSPCPYANQSSSRDAKVVDDGSVEKPVDVKTSISK